MLDSIRRTVISSGADCSKGGVADNDNRKHRTGQILEYGELMTYRIESEGCLVVDGR